MLDSAGKRYLRDHAAWLRRMDGLLLDGCRQCALLYDYDPAAEFWVPVEPGDPDFFLG